MRQLLVVLHILTSVGWMAMALAQVTLVAYGLTSGGDTRLAAYTMAGHLDHLLLQNLATTSAYSGLMLSALTSWGLLRFWWVAVKFGLTLSCLYLGIFHLGQWLDQAVRAAAAGGTGAASTVQNIAGGTAIIVAICFMAWVSEAKPWGRLRRAARGRRDAEPHPAVFAMAIAVPIVDVTAVLTGLLPGPLLSMLTVLAYPACATYRKRTADVTHRHRPRVEGIKIGD